MLLKAITSKLLVVTIDGARGILVNVTGGPNMTLYEVNQAAALIKETTHPNVNLIFGAVVDEKMEDATEGLSESKIDAPTSAP